MAISMVFVLLKVFWLDSLALITNERTVMTIERSRDKNYIVYDVNVDKGGNLNPEKPLEIYWVKENKQNKKEPLTWIQNKYAYGIKIIDQNPECVVFQFAPYDKKNFVIRKSAGGNYAVFSDFGGSQVQVTHIFIQIDGGTFWFPKIPKIDIHCIDQATLQKKTTTINP
jgi:hypothetical protein